VLRALFAPGLEGGDARRKRFVRDPDCSICVIMLSVAGVSEVTVG